MGTSKILIDGVGIDLTADTVAANKMLSGIKAHDANGDVVTGNIPSKAAQTYTPGTSNQTIDAGQYLGGAQTIQGDANLVAANIASGKTIFGVAGTHAGQKSEQSKTLTLGANAPTTITPDSGKVLSSVPVTIDTSVIKAENIAKDVQILGVTGTHEGGGGGLEQQGCQVYGMIRNSIVGQTIAIGLCNNCIFDAVSFQQDLKFVSPFEMSNSVTFDGCSGYTLKFDPSLIGISTLPQIALNSDTEFREGIEFPWGYGEVELHFIINESAVTEAQLNAMIPCRYNVT